MTTDSRPWLLVDVDGVLNVDRNPTDSHNKGFHTIFVKVSETDNTVPYELVSRDEFNSMKSEWKNWKRAYRTAGNFIPAPTHNVYRVQLDPNLPARFQQLSEVFRLAWATTWENGANDVLLPYVGLSEPLPVIVFGDNRTVIGLHHWKSPKIVEWLPAGDSFVWIDDECSQYDVRFFDNAFGNRSRGRVLRTNPRLGLDDTTVNRLLNLVGINSVAEEDDE